MIKRIAAILVGVIAIALIAIWFIALPWMATHPQREALTTTPASLGMRYSDVVFPTQGGALKLRGWWMPAAKPRAVLVYVHGANTNRRDAYASGLEISKFLVDQGVSVLAPDLRNHGQSDGSSSGALTLGYEESKDVVGAVDYAAAQAPGLPIYVMGVSMGGAASIYAVARDPRVERLVLFDPYLAPHQTSLNLLHAMVPAPRWALSPVLWIAETFIIGDAARHSPLAIAKGLKLPILLIQDDRDPVCAPSNARQLAQANPAVTHWVSRDPPGDGKFHWFGFAGHTAAFHLHPAEMQRQLSAFLSPRGAAPSPAVTDGQVAMR